MLTLVWCTHQEEMVGMNLSVHCLSNHWYPCSSPVLHYLHHQLHWSRQSVQLSTCCSTFQQPQLLSQQRRNQSLAISYFSPVCLLRQCTACLLLILFPILIWIKTQDLPRFSVRILVSSIVGEILKICIL